MVLTVSNRQRAIKVDTKLIQSLAVLALPLCLAQPGRGEAVLPGLESVDVSLVSDRVITSLHHRFMNIPGPTDVITFAHGEVIISAATAERQARDHRQYYQKELFRYVVHGLLHLNGHADATAEEAALMWKAQEQVVAGIWPSADGASIALHRSADRKRHNR